MTRRTQARLDPFREALAALSPTERDAFTKGWRLLVDAHDRQRDPTTGGHRADHRG
ncbi:MAG TPA: hypothetical protein VGN37_28175 [Actinocatenispora sp.]